MGAPMESTSTSILNKPDGDVMPTDATAEMAADSMTTDDSDFLIRVSDYQIILQR